MVYTNWTEARNVLVAGLPGGGSDTVLTSLLATLTARMSPAELQLWMVTGSRDLPSPVSRLPHVVRSTEARTGQALLEELNAELSRRIDAVENSDGVSPTTAESEPRIVLVVGELAEPGLDKGILDVLVGDGPTHGIQVLAATSNADALDDGTVDQFQTRFVLQTINEPQSVRLIGAPDAVELAPGGELLFRLDGRRPIRMRAFQVPAEDLEDLLAQMNRAYGNSIVQTPSTDVAPESIEEIVTGENTSIEEEQLTIDGFDSECSAQEGSAIADVEPPSCDRPQIHVEDVTSPPWDGRAESVERTLESSALEMSEPGVSSLAGALGLEAADARLSSPVAAPAASSRKAAIAVAEPITGVGTLVHVQCFGRLRVTSEGTELVPESAAGPRYKAWEILAYLACQPTGQVSKEKLMEALWPEKSAHDADDSVRVNLAALRDILVEQVQGISRDVIWTKNGVCRLDLSVVTTDVTRFCELCERLPGMSINDAAQAFEELEGLYSGDLVTEPLYDWVDAHMDGASLRQDYREKFRKTTFGLARRFQQTGQPALAIPLYERLLQSEPGLEDVIRELYRCHHQLGNAGAIVRIDKELRRGLRQTYGEHADRSLLNPEPQTDQLYQQLLADLRSGTQHNQAAVA